MTRFRALLLGLAGLFVAFVAVEYFRPQPTDWSPTFINRDKVPYGTYVLYDQLPALFPNQPISTVRLPIANQLLPGLGVDVNTDTTITGSTPALRPDRASYLFINTSFYCSALDQDALLRYVARGSHVLIVGEEFGGALLDSLHLELRPVLEIDSLLLLRQLRRGGLAANNGAVKSPTTRLTLVNSPIGATKKYPFPTSEIAYFFRATAGSRATVLAHDAHRRPVLVRVPVGRGQVLLSSTPAAFSNLRLLQPATAGFTFAVLSQLPAGQPVFWDEYQKQGALGEQSLLRVLKSHEPLRWSLWMGLAGLVLFVLFEARRRQRIVPIIKPLPNTTLLFTSTVASLYQQGSNHALIAEKKIGLFQDFLRTRYHEPSLDLTNEPTRERLARKAGVPRPELDELVRRMNWVLTARQVSDEELLALSRAISRFRRAAA